MPQLVIVCSDLFHNPQLIYFQCLVTIVCYFTACSGSAADLVFVVDSSGSIRDANPSDGSYDNWNLILTFMRNIVNGLDIGYTGYRVGLVRYSENADNIFYLNTYTSKSQLLNALINVQYIGSFTNTAGGLREMTYTQFTSGNGDRADYPNVAVVITDGKSNIDANRVLSDAVTAQGLGIKIISVGITAATDPAEVKGVSSPPQQQNQDWFMIQDFQDLQNSEEVIRQSTCSSSNTGKESDMFKDEIKIKSQRNLPVIKISKAS